MTVQKYVVFRKAVILLLGFLEIVVQTAIVQQITSVQTTIFV